MGRSRRRRAAWRSCERTPRPSNPLTAMEAFNDWFDHFHKGQPVRPVLTEGASFTEKVAHEQREKVYQGEMERWRGGQVVQSRQAEERIRAVLAFPGGWLVEEER